MLAFRVSCFRHLACANHHHHLLHRKHHLLRTMSTHAGASPVWQQHWENGIAPGTRWDAAQPLPHLLSLLKAKTFPAGARVLVPGCGRGYDAVAFANAGHPTVGLDLAPKGVEMAQSYVQSLSDPGKANADTLQTVPAPGQLRLQVGDFFEHKDQYDLAFDYTFLCALDPSVRERWAQHYADIIRPGGELLTVVYPMDDREGGPPFKLSLELVHSLLEPVGFKEISTEKLGPGAAHAGRENISGFVRWRRS